MCGNSIKLISIIGIFILTGCHFIDRHPDLVNDIKKIEKEAIDDEASDVKIEIDNQSLPVKSAKVANT